LRTLASLTACQPPCFDVEVIVIVNDSVSSPADAKTSNADIYKALQVWNEEQSVGWLKLHCLYFPDQTDKYAGVGQARKIGLDEAVSRFELAGKKDGLLVSLDADCEVEPTYFQAIYDHFQLYPACPAAHLYFEHPLSGMLSEANYEGIVRYELYLRYYRHGLKFAASPYAHYAIGSCIVVRNEVYQKSGGMNRRKAGEDFYFLQKIIALGGFGEITTTTVFPSSRLSERVPFGTGKAVEKWIRSEEVGYPAENPEIFKELGLLFMQLPLLYEKKSFDSLNLSALMRCFLNQMGYSEKLLEVVKNSTSQPLFQKRFLTGFNGFMCMKFAHFATESLPLVDLSEAVRQLLSWSQADLNGDSYMDLLLTMRKIDKKQGKLCAY
jgi:hypothetical protein